MFVNDLMKVSRVLPKWAKM